MKMISLKMSVLAIIVAGLMSPAFADSGSTYSSRSGSSFGVLDDNADGYISSNEAQGNRELISEWDNLDTDNNDRLDISEFSAFETMERSIEHPLGDESTFNPAY